MRALVVTASGGVEVVERPEPRPEAGEVVIDVHSCGICGSDVHSIEYGTRQPGQPRRVRGAAIASAHQPDGQRTE